MISDKGLGQYDGEYRDCACFWGTEPGKYVKLLLKHIQKGSILDFGAGEGKNAIFLAERGFDVTAVECSIPGLKNFQLRLRSVNEDIKKRIFLKQEDVRIFQSTQKFDAVIAYGLLHCLPNEDDIVKVIQTMKKNTIKNGFNVIVTFTPDKQDLEVQSYLEPTLLKSEKLLENYKDWEIISFEKDLIQESHPTSRILHTHSLCRLLTRNSCD